MCLIIYSPKGSDKNQQFLEEAIRKAAEFNSDGMGYAVKYSDNKIWMNKGFFNVDDFIEDIRENDIKDEDELLIHLRIGNVGKVDASMCHPFLVSKESEEILEINEGWIEKPILAHNGTMTKYKIKDSDQSDTFHFIKDVLSEESVMNFLVSDSILFDKLMQSHLLSSRIALMFPDERDSILLGEWHEEKGFLFSKDYYKEYFKNSYQTNLKLLSPPQDYNNWDWDDDQMCWIYNPSANTACKKNNKIIRHPNNIAKNNKESLISGVPKLAYQRPNYISLGGTGMKYSLYMGLFLPEVISEYKLFNIEITSDSINIIKIYIVADSKFYDIRKGFNYDLFDCDQYTITVQESISNEIITIDRNDFYDIFDTYVNNYDKGFYNEYYNLVVTTPVTKTCLKKLNKKFNTALNYRHDKIKFRDLEVSRDVVELFLREGEQEIDYQKYPHKLLF